MHYFGLLTICNIFFNPSLVFGLPLPQFGTGNGGGALIDMQIHIQDIQNAAALGNLNEVYRLATNVYQANIQAQPTSTDNLNNIADNTGSLADLLVQVAFNAVDAETVLQLCQQAMSMMGGNSGFSYFVMMAGPDSTGPTPNYNSNSSPLPINSNLNTSALQINPNLNSNGLPNNLNLNPNVLPVNTNQNSNSLFPAF